MKLFISLIITLSLLACNQKKNITSTNELTKAEVKAQDLDYKNDCFEGRAVTKEVTDIEAEIVMVMDMFMFNFDNTRWQPCEVPEAFQREGLKVKVSGQVLEIKPNERRAGTPFYISSLSKR